ncbi:MAG: MBL fold metallo-hydrolase [Clostridia bacterium]|nr:MBL fold metallo-hydrolase [Clostridia bacterium]
MKNLKWLIALLAASTLFCACQKQETPNTTDTTDTTAAAETTVPAPATIDLVAGGEAKYVIVRPESATQAEIDAAIAIRTEIESLTGVAPTLTTDWIKRGQEYDSSTLEILVGGCGQPEVAEVRSTIGYGDYAVKPCGNKLVVTAWGDQGVTAAAHYFKSSLKEHSAAGSLALPADFALSGTSNKMVNLLPLYAGGEIGAIVDVADDNQMVYITDTTAEEYTAYRKQLETAGYTLYTERKVEKNLFATYTNAQNTVTAYYTACDGETRIIIEPASALPPRAEDTTTAGDKYEPAVRMVGLEYNYSGDDYNQIGLFLIFRLPDGRLIVVDGGGYYDKNTSLIMQNLQEMAPDKDNITIAAWMLTHAHGDHTGGFIKFANAYGTKVTVERVICNFTTKAQYALVNDYGRDDQARTAAATLAKEVIKAHNGQIYHFGGATMEILYTFEDFEPEALPYHNTTSLVFRISMGGQTVMVLGDAYTLSNNIMSSMYGDYLKSDIVQVTHHGYQGGTVQVYNLINADTAIWPGGVRNFDKLSARTENAHVIKISRDLYIAGDDAITLTLPYTVQNNNKYYAG